MKPVCKLDQDHTDILGHGKKHLAKALCLHLHLICGVGQLSDLGHAINQKSHLRPEFLGDLLASHPGILHSVMEKSCNDGLLIQFQICQNNCYA